MPPYVRRQPLLDRVQSLLNPYDFWLWLSEELETSGWERVDNKWAIIIGITLNLILLFAQANSKARSRYYEDVFGEASGPSWTVWLVRPFLAAVRDSNTDHPTRLLWEFMR